MVDRNLYMDEDLIHHCNNVREVCNLIYEGPLKVQLLRAAEIHDLGKYFISDKVLRAPRALTIAERLAVDMHSQLGYYEAKSQSEDELVCQVIVLHHGIGKVGLPAILSALMPEAVELFPYIMAADIYSAIRENRPYHKGKTHAEAISVVDGIRDIPNSIKEVVREFDALQRDW